MEFKNERASTDMTCLSQTPTSNNVSVSVSVSMVSSSSSLIPIEPYVRKRPLKRPHPDSQTD